MCTEDCVRFLCSWSFFDARSQHITTTVILSSLSADVLGECFLSNGVVIAAVLLGRLRM